MSLTFYYAPMSSASITELILEELGVPCDRVKLDIQKGDTKKPEYLAVNPNGKVPCIVHDGSVIWESAALTIYLGEAFGVERGLFPAPGPRRGEAMKWIVWTNVTLGDAMARWTRNTLDWFPAEQHNAKAAEAAKADLAGCLKVLDQSLAGRQFLVGDYTLADTHLNSFCDWLRYMKVDFAPFPGVEAWGERCRARPAYKKVMAGAGAG
ncbi:MAG TPA: glutathione S-transferase family protein [Kofleriaceae bacterium]|jgi:glutathione S-transferase|nr:glutathione S-transferase family protein [Kofleriaceae bacterium]